MAISDNGYGIVNPTLQTSGKSTEVRRVFENASKYLESRRVDIQVRKQAVKTFARRVSWKRLLDVGCGDGKISLQLLTHSSTLTLLDLSSTMATMARANVPEEFSENVSVRNENFMTASFEPGSFDLIVSVGVLAHVDSPEEFIARVSSLIRPGGGMIIEFTDSRHIVGRIGHIFGRLKEFIAPSKYPTNRLSFEIVAPIFRKYNLRVVAMFRYARLPIPSIEKIVPAVIHEKLVNFIFGVAGNNTAAWLGNEYICLLTRECGDQGDKSKGEKSN